MMKKIVSLSILLMSGCSSTSFDSIPNYSADNWPDTSETEAEPSDSSEAVADIGWIDSASSLADSSPSPSDSDIADSGTIATPDTGSVAPDSGSAHDAPSSADAPAFDTAGWIPCAYCQGYCPTADFDNLCWFSTCHRGACHFDEYRACHCD